MSSSNDGISEIIPNPPAPQPLLLYLFSGMMALSILCYVFVFYHFSTSPTIRRRLNNHVIFLLLAIYFIQTIFDTPLHLDFFRRGIYWPPSLNYCFLLLMLDYVTYEIALQLMLWASIERHLLIFNPNMFNTPRRRLFGHFLPLGYSFIYPTMYYIYFIILYPCERYYDFQTSSCMVTCFLWTNNTMAYFELIFNGFLPCCLIALFSIALLIRVCWQKQQMGRQMTWRKNRKMTVQLLGISTTFLAFNLGYFIIALIQMVRDPNFGSDVMVWFFSINVCAPQLIFPFLCLSTIPDLKRKLRSLNPCRYRFVVVPVDAPLPVSKYHPTRPAAKDTHMGSYPNRH